MSNFFKDKRIVVTGGAGFLGRYVTEGLDDRGCENILVPRRRDYDLVRAEDVARMYDDMKPDESLLICCKSYSKACESRYLNITVKKIPNMLLGRCEFGMEDYSLNIVSMPVDPDAPDFVPEGPPEEKKIKTKKNADIEEPTLFNTGND